MLSQFVDIFSGGQRLSLESYVNHFVDVVDATACHNNQYVDVVDAVARER